MNNRTLINLSVLLLVGILALAGKNYYSTYQVQKPNAYLKGLIALNRDQINKISIAKGSQSLELIKNANEWRVGSKSADSTKVLDLLTALYPSSSPVLITQSEEQRKNLEVTADTATKVVVGNGKTDLTFLVGRLTGADTIVAINGQQGAYGLRNVPVIDTQADPWFNLSVIDLDTTAIKKMAYVSGKNSYTVNHNDNQWSFENDPARANSDGLNTFTMKFNPLKAKGLAFDKKQREYNLKSADFSWVITDVNGDTKLDFYKGRNDYLVKRSPNDEFYVIDKSTGDEFNKNKESFVMPESQQ